MLGKQIVKQFVVVQPLSRLWLFTTPWTATHQASLSFTNSQSLLKTMSIEWVSANYLILFCPIFLFPSIFPSIKVYSNESALCIRWPKFWSFSIIPSNEYSGLISFRIDWFDLLVVQQTLKESSPAPRFKSINSSVLSLLYSPTFTAIHVSSAYLRLLIFLPAILISVWDSPSLVFLIRYSAYKLNKQGDNIRPWHTLFSILNQSIESGSVLTVASCPACRFLRRQ